MSEKLVLSFDPKTIEHLGIKMYSTLPPAIAELIANAYDACAKEVLIKLFDSETNKRIEVIDNGTGMTFDEVNDYFLRIGRNRRQEKQNPPCDRYPTGKKGLGKLALFGIGKQIEVITCKDGQETRFIMDWDEIINSKGEYTPGFDISECSESGTKIIVHGLKRKSPFDLDNLAISIAKLFNFNDSDFSIKLVLNDEDERIIDRDLKYRNIEQQFVWKLPEAIDELLENDPYPHKQDLSGIVFTSEKPLPPGLRGITLYANGRMVNLPEFFGVSESSHFFSYLTGYIDVDFVDRWEIDVISTDRQSLDWENEKLSELQAFLKRLILAISKDWRVKRKEKNKQKAKEAAGFDSNEWLSKIPDVLKSKLEELILTVTDEESELSSEKQTKVIKTMREIVPEYPYFHWRNLHPEIQKVSQRYYENQDYYTAFLEALKRYVAEVRRKSGSTNSNDRSLMGEVFSKRKLSVTEKYKKSDGSDFSANTIKNIEEGQQYLSEGAVVGGRNPLSHEEHIELSTSGLFSEKDCLDFLSLLSHLFKRLDDSVQV